MSFYADSASWGGADGSAGARLSHEQWLARKERDRMQEKRSKSARRHRRAAEQKKEQSKQSFDRWLSKKDLRERATDLLARLDEGRAADEEQWFEAAVALSAVDTALGVGTIDACDCEGICQDRSHRITRQAERCACPRRKCIECNRCVGGEGDPNCCVQYDENNNPIKPTVRDPTKRPCSCAVRSLAEEWIAWTMQHHMFLDVEVTRAERAEMTDLTQAAMAPVEGDETKFVLPSLQYMFQSKPKKKPEFVVPGTKTRRKFEAAKDSRPLTRDQKLLNALFMKHCKREWRRARRAMLQKLGQFLEDQDANDQRRQEEAAKEEKLQGRRLAAAEPKTLSGDALLSRRARRERAGLMQLGVRKMALWIEQDAEALEEREADNRRRAEDENRANFEARERNRRAGRGRRGPAAADAQPQAKPRFDFGRGPPAVRPNPQIKPARAPRAEDKSDAAEAAYNAWLQQKLLREKAQTMLSFVDAPADVTDDPDEREEYWREVGQIVKAVDRALLKSFAEWTGAFHTPGYCQRMWDTWAPVSCDMHSSTSSVVRDTFIKLLHRRGQANFEHAFDNVMDRKLRVLERKSEDFRNDDADEFRENFALSRPEFRRLLQTELGITLQDDEARRLIDCFDANMDGMVSRKEFLDFMSQTGDPSTLLSGRCLWQTACYECGMQNAFTVGVLRHRDDSDGEDDEDGEGAQAGRDAARASRVVRLKNGERRRVTELPDHRWLCRREGHADAPRQTCVSCRLQAEQGERHSGSEVRNGELAWCTGEEPPRACAAATWTREKRDRALSKLRRLSKGNREIKRVQDMMANGEPPAAPKLKSVDLVEDGRAELKSTALLLRWRPDAQSLVSFFLLESSGPVGSKTQRAHQFAEICRDPPSAEDAPSLSFLVTGLAPNTSYSFRIRALNGFGPGAYTHATFTTYPAPPPKPTVLRVGSTSAYLQWRQPSSDQAKQLKRLRALFHDIDKDGSGGISRDEFLAEIDAHPEMLEFLQATPVGGATGAADGNATTTVFDAIEADDDEEITWPEFLSFFQVQQAQAHSRRRRSTATQGGTAGVLQGSGDASATSNESIGNTTYILQRCVNDNRSEFTPIFKGSAPEYNVTGLEAGSSAKFRAVAVNCDGKQSEPSEPVVVNTMLPTPRAPRVASRGQVISTTFVRLCWDAAAGAGAGKRQDTNSVAAVLSEWAATDADARGLADGADGGLSIQKAFRTYDEDHSGYIDGRELENLLRDLGVNPTEERLREAWATFDTDDDQRVSFDEFAAWWVAQDVFYVVRRDHGLPVEAAAGLNLQEPPVSSPFDIQCHRGPIPKCEVAGLEPNTLYQFRLRVVSPRSQSAFSRSLAIITAPSMPLEPAAVWCGETEARLRWYPGLGGAARYVLQAKFVDALSEADHARAMRSGSRALTAGEFTTVYEGSEAVAVVPGLAPNCVYRFRVAAVNAMRLAGEYSEMLQCNTSTDEPPLRPATAGEAFTVECTGDVVVGDTILFTERLCLGPDGKLLEANVAFDAGPLQLGASGTPRLNVSVSSIDSLATPQGGEFIGERTIAAVVLKEQLQRSSTRAGRVRRVLQLQVVWSTVSRKSAEPYMIGAGQKITRRANKLFAFETFRMRWVNEELRKSAEEEGAYMARVTRS